MLQTCMNRILLVLTSACHTRLGWLALLYGDLRTPPAVDLEACVPRDGQDNRFCETLQVCPVYAPYNHCRVESSC